MTLPDESIETILKTFRRLAKIHNFRDHHYKSFSQDSKEPDIDPSGTGVCSNYLYVLVHYRMNVRPTIRVEIILRKLIAKLKLEYPLGETKVNKRRKKVKVNG